MQTSVQSQDDFAAGVKNYLTHHPLDMYYPDDINQALEADPRDSTGFWVNAKIWISFNDLSSVVENERRQEQLDLAWPGSDTLQ